MAGSVHIPWYSTLFRADRFELALAEIAPIALRYGATEYAAYRYNDDRYKFQQTASFANKDDFERYWYGEEFIAWRGDHASWYQVPVLYGWTDIITAGRLGDELLASADA